MGFSTILGGGGGGGVSQVNFTLQTNTSQAISALYSANSITDAAGVLVAIQNNGGSAITLTTTGSILNRTGYAAITSTNSVTIAPNQTVVLETDLANLDYYVVAYSLALNLNAGVAGAVPYQTAVNATGFSAAGTTGQVLLSGGTGAPTWSTSAPLSTSLFGGTAGSLAYQSAPNVTAFLGLGAANTVLVSNGTTPGWQSAAPRAVSLSAGATGSLPYQALAGSTAYLNIGTAGQTLIVSGGLPAWAAAAPLATNLQGGVAGAVPYQTAINTTGFSAAGTANQLLRSSGTGAPTWTSTISITNAIFTQGGNAGSPIAINSSNTRGGAGFAEQITFANLNAGTTNGNKFLRMDAVGSLQFLNSLYTATIFEITDGGALSAPLTMRLTGTNSSLTAPISAFQVQGNASTQNVAFTDPSFNLVLGDPTKTGTDTYIESGRNIYLSPNGNTSSNRAQSVTINTAGQITTPATIGNSFYATAYVPLNTPAGVVAQLDNIKAGVIVDSGSSLRPAIGAVTGTFQAYSSGTLIKGATVTAYNNTLASNFNTTLASYIGSGTIGSGGDTFIGYISDITNFRTYRITYIHSVGTTDASISIERIA